MYKNGVVAWKSIRATLAAMSSCEAELQAASLGFLVGLGVQAGLESVGGRADHQLRVDNTAATSIIGGSQTWRTRHLAVRASAVRTHFQAGLVEVVYEPTGTQVADLLTKNLPAHL